jgi:hypothetical protein
MGCVNPWIDRINQLDADHQAGRIADDDYSTKRTWMLQQYQNSEIRTAERNQVFTELSGGTTYTTYGQRSTVVPMLQTSVAGGYGSRSMRQAQRTRAPKKERIVGVRTPRVPAESPRMRSSQPLVIPPVPHVPVQRRPATPAPKRDSSELIVEAALGANDPAFAGTNDE